MKNLIFLLVFLTSTSIIISQSPVSKGVYSASGIISYSHFSDDFDGRNTSTSSFVFAPSFGYFFFDNIYTGVNLFYGYYTAGENSDDQYGFGPQIRYYIDLNNKIIPFLGLGYSYRSSGDYLHYSTYAFSGGVDIFIARNFALEGSLNYEISKHNFTSNYILKDYTSRTFQVLMGVNYFIF